MEPKDITLEYVLQPHVISRAAYKLSTMAKRIIVMSMAMIPFDNPNLISTFSIFEFCKAFNLKIGGETYKSIKEAIDELFKNVIHIETEDKWTAYNWIHKAEIDKKTNNITIRFNEELKNYLLSIKKMYCRIELLDFSKLESIYSNRIFELAKSYESLAGKNGNKKNCWYFERSIEELRKIFQIEKGKYVRTNNLITKIIEAPIAEINNANLGLKIEPEYIRKGRCLVVVRFKCEKTLRKPEIQKKKDLPEPAESPIDTRDLHENDLKKVKNLYPEEYEVMYYNKFKGKPNLFSEKIKNKIICQELIDKYGITF